MLLFMKIRDIASHIHWKWEMVDDGTECEMKRISVCDDDDLKDLNSTMLGWCCKTKSNN